MQHHVQQCEIQWHSTFLDCREANLKVAAVVSQLDIRYVVRTPGMRDISELWCVGYNRLHHNRLARIA